MRPLPIGSTNCICCCKKGYRDPKDVLARSLVKNIDDIHDLISSGDLTLDEGILLMEDLVSVIKDIRKIQLADRIKEIIS